MALDESSILQLEESQSLISSDYEEQPYWKMRSIYRVPAHITALNPEAYRPRVVSFGPYHHGEDSLLPMEEHKRRAVRQFLKRSKKPLRCFINSLKEVAQALEESYDALDSKWKAGRGEGAALPFLDLMITDGCFMLEILRFETKEVDDYAPNDPIFSKHGSLFITADIFQDALMLENQLPMLVLDRLMAVESDGKKDDKFVDGLILELIQHFYFHSEVITGMGKCLHFLDVFRHSMLVERNNKDEEVDGYVNRLIPKFCFPSEGITGMGKCLHVLDVFRKCMPMDREKKDDVEGHFSEMTYHLASATELREHGIRFKRSKTNSLKDISFVDGVLRLPAISVDSSTMSNFLNLMAFERSHVEAGSEVASYIYCKDLMISNARDVQVLRAEGIILNLLESDEAVATMFNSLGRYSTICFESNLIDVLEKVNKYCNKRWNMWRANLIHTYFSNPWVTLSLIAAVFLFALTIIQTVYSVLDYRK
ncbi:hypothetical protein EUGRSUZ_L01084 [Eucalyptus grandis]|uniref:Uncharacterized protein n=3 Tax=Eucalyptus grandis TaxID=71139 RepID=A0AAD9TBB2_EUCGR|nr:hypothetical protein EUGRSUZ_L01084 [Eucalyptus grandis]